MAAAAPFSLPIMLAAYLKSFMAFLAMVSCSTYSSVNVCTACYTAIFVQGVHVDVMRTKLLWSMASPYFLYVRIQAL